jgi:hypothetical protein
MSQNLTKSISSGTICGIKVVAVNGVEKFDDLWAVRYTRLTRRGVKQGAVFYATRQKKPRQSMANYWAFLSIIMDYIWAAKRSES